MMCFGDQKQKTVDTSYNPNSSVAAAANTNMTTATGALANANNRTFGQQYQGPLTAAIAPNQQGTIDRATGIANDGTGAAAKSLISGYAAAPAASVNANSIQSNMSPYMNQYVMDALAPQLHQQDLTLAANRNATNATATGSGAFGDARTGIEQSNNNFNDAIARQGLIGNAYNSAFNTAIGAGAQDSANQLTAGTTNANLGETALNRQATGATALQGLQSQQLGVQTGANALTQQDTAQQQAALTAQYNNWLQAQQSQLLAQQSASGAVHVGAAAMPANKSEVTSAPDNSGLGLLGSLGGAALNAFIPGAGTLASAAFGAATK